MSYCRFSHDSDVYMFPHVDGFIVCMACRISNDDRFFYYRSVALLHLQKHKEENHKVPKRAIENLQKELAEKGNKIK